LRAQVNDVERPESFIIISAAVNEIVAPAAQQRMLACVRGIHGRDIQAATEQLIHR